MRTLSFTTEQIDHAEEYLSGYCLSCGAERFDVEPDTRGEECPECGARRVYGAEELVQMGRVY